MRAYDEAQLHSGPQVHGALQPQPVPPPPVWLWQPQEQVAPEHDPQGQDSVFLVM